MLELFKLFGIVGLKGVDKTKKDLKDLQPFSISVYGKVSSCVSPLYVWEGHGNNRTQSQIAWYVVDDSCYSREGFDLKKTMIAGFEDI